MAQLNELTTLSINLARNLGNWLKYLEDVKVQDLDGPGYKRIYAEATMEKRLKMFREFSTFLEKETSDEKKMSHSFNQNTALMFDGVHFHVITGPDAQAILAGKPEYMATHVVNTKTQKTELAGHFSTEKQAEINHKYIRDKVHTYGDNWNLPIEKFFQYQRPLRMTNMRTGFVFVTGQFKDKRFGTVICCPFEENVIATHFEEKHAIEYHANICSQVCIVTYDKDTDEEYFMKCMSIIGLLKPVENTPKTSG